MATAAESPAGLTRREFLYYVWGASLALFTAEATGLMIWFMLPRFREGEFGGTFTLDAGILPEVNGDPYNFPDGRFWLVNLDTTVEEGCERMWEAPGDNGAITGVAAIYKVCTHLGCIYAWNPGTSRFECPCHGSKYRLDGRRIEDPAPRSLDRFKLSALDENEAELGAAALVDGEYQPLVLPPGTRFIRVDTGDKQEGESRPLLKDFVKTCP